MIRRLALAVMLATTTAFAAGAQDLKLGTKLELTTLDPHFFNSFISQSTHVQIYEALATIEADQSLSPALAVSWKLVDDLTWEFSLRRGVRFHDGSAFTADDVIASYGRVPKVPNSPGLFTTFVASIASMTKIDDHTLRIVTKAPNPILPRDLARVFIISAKQAEMPTAAFNDGSAANGTGSYRLQKWTLGEDLVLIRNDAYWGAKADWARVHERVIKTDSARLAALLSGEVDAIDEVPIADTARVRTDNRLRFASGPAGVVQMLFVDSARDVSPFVVAKDGTPLTRNPLRDARVRKALSLAINREAITDRLMEGTASPAGQFLPANFEGTSDRVQPDPFDLPRAQALLREAGWGDGFQITLHTTSDRYPRDRETAQAIAQMWTRLGLVANVDGVPGAVYFGRAAKQEFSIFVSQYGAGEMGQSMRAVVHSFDSARGLGALNLSRYANTAIDEMIREALSAMDLSRRNALLARSLDAAIADQAFIPLFFPRWTYASKPNIEVVPRPERRFNAQMIRPRG